MKFWKILTPPPPPPPENIVNKISLSNDVFSNSQIESKLWLCREIEKLFHHKKQPQVIWVLGGWIGLLSFLLFSRERLNIKAIRSFDKDPFSTEKADIVNENWVFRQWLFKAKTIDCNKLSYKNLFFADSEMPDLIINTSTEHFESLEWWDNIPFGKTVALQSCDLKLKDHVRPIHSERQFEEIFPAKKILYSGTKKFIYPDNSFNRYTLIVEK